MLKYILYIYINLRGYVVDCTRWPASLAIKTLEKSTDWGKYICEHTMNSLDKLVFNLFKCAYLLISLP